METRLVVVYTLISLLALLTAALVVWMRYNTRERTVARQRRRAQVARDRRRGAPRGPDER